MTNEFYDPGEKRVAKVKELFTRIAPQYDLMNDLQSFGLHRYWKRLVVRLADPHPGDIALDLCCGTGDLTLALAHQGAKVVGLDLTARMLRTALDQDRWKSQQQHSGEELPAGCDSARAKAHLVLADAVKTPFADRSFDIVTVGYGLRNLADWTAGLVEMNRVAKPGARLIILDFGKPDNRLWRGLYFSYLRLFVPLLGRIFCGSASAYGYILESLKEYPAQQGVAAKMRQMGLQNVRIVNLLGGIMSINYAEKPGTPQCEGQPCQNENP